MYARILEKHAGAAALRAHFAPKKTCINFTWVTQFDNFSYMQKMFSDLWSPVFQWCLLYYNPRKLTLLLMKEISADIISWFNAHVGVLQESCIVKHAKKSKIFIFLLK